METPGLDDQPLSKWWRHAAILVAIAGFAILSFVTARTYRDAPPIAERAVGPDGATVYSKADVLRGQEVFLQYALMEHGSLWGHGAYLGPDYSASYLHRSTEIMRDAHAEERHGKPYSALAPAEASGIADTVRRELKSNGLDAAAETLLLSKAAVESFTVQRAEWRAYFGSDATPPGLPTHYIDDPARTDALTAYFAWAAWATTANRPGEDYSYTNNWPFDPAAGNTPSTAAYFWSAMSLITLLGGLGAVARR